MPAVTFMIPRGALPPGERGPRVHQPSRKKPPAGSGRRVQFIRELTRQPHPAWRSCFASFFATSLTTSQLRDPIASRRRCSRMAVATAPEGRTSRGTSRPRSSTYTGTTADSTAGASSSAPEPPACRRPARGRPPRHRASTSPSCSRRSGGWGCSTRGKATSSRASPSCSREETCPPTRPLSSGRSSSTCTAGTRAICRAVKSH